MQSAFFFVRGIDCFRYCFEFLLSSNRFLIDSSAKCLRQKLVLCIFHTHVNAGILRMGIVSHFIAKSIWTFAININLYIFRMHLNSHLNILKWNYWLTSVTGIIGYLHRNARWHLWLNRRLLLVSKPKRRKCLVNIKSHIDFQLPFNFISFRQH